VTGFGQDRRSELEDFKTQINLVAYMQQHGYQLDKRESSRSSAVLRNAKTGDKLIVARGTDGHWQYFSVRDDRDSGSIVDFVQNRRRLNLGEVRRELRGQLGISPSPAAAPELVAVRRDIQQIVAQVHRMQSAAEAGLLGYLVTERKIPAEVLRQTRFVRSVLQDPRGNIVFPHRNQDGICGFELKNSGFTGFSPGGSKGLWFSGIRPDDKLLVVTESAIDALSHAALFADPHCGYCSIAGQPSDGQIELLVKAVGKWKGRRGEDARVLLSFDNDGPGKALAIALIDKLGKLADLDPELKQLCSGHDWNDRLRLLNCSPVRQLSR